MSIYEKNLNGTEEIFNEVKALVDNGKIGSKLEIVRMFSAAQREYDKLQLVDKFRERVGQRYIEDIVILDEKSAIVSYRRTKDLNSLLYYQPIVLSNFTNIAYETFDQALIGMVCLKTDNLQADRWINKMLGIDVEETKG